MARILILDPDEQFAMELFAALAGEHSVSSTSMMREACLIISQQPQDVAFIPHADYESVLASLRRLQPALRVVVTTEEEQLPLPGRAHAALQGVLTRSRMHETLPAVLQEALAWPLPEVQQNGRLPAQPNQATLTALLQLGIDDERLLSIVLSEAGQLTAHAGTLDDTQAGRVARQVAESWQAEQTAQIQFIGLPGRSNELLLYTRPAGDEQLLTLAALPETAVTPLRERADLLAQKVLQVLEPSPVADAESPAEPQAIAQARPEPAVNRVAILWRPVAALPAALFLPLRQALERIATANACVLNHVEVQRGYVHLLVTCPPGRDSAWVAHCFKRGTEQEIQQEFGVRVALWRQGFLAAAATEPFNAQEIALFLKSPAAGEAA